MWGMSCGGPFTWPLDPADLSGRGWEASWKRPAVLSGPDRRMLNVPGRLARLSPLAIEDAFTHVTADLAQPGFLHFESSLAVQTEG